MQHLTTLQMLFAGKPQFRFNRKQNKLFLDVDWTRDFNVGEYVVIECYRKLNPDTVTLTGTATLSNTSKTVTGSGTIFDQELCEGDIVNFGTESIQVDKIKSPTELTLISTPTTSNSGIDMTITGMIDVWNDRFLKSYATAKIKYQWGNNMKKFGGIQLPGGVTLNGKEIYDEAAEELKALEEFTYNTTSMPSEIFIG
jgi:hypothetical protein